MTPDSPPSARSDLIREVNGAIVEAAERLQPARGEHWDFYCECESGDCTSIVRLTLEEYASLRDGGRPVLADGHLAGRAEGRGTGR